METKEIEEIKKQLDDVEFYSPTMPLPWQTYHSIIRRLMKEVENVHDQNRTESKR